MLKIGEMRAQKGERTSGFVSVCDGVGGCVQFPAILVCGARPGPILWVNAGIHGAEYPGIEAAMRVARNVSPADLKGSLIVLPIVNVPAFYSRSIYVCPLDGKNLNRVFPGDSSGSVSEVLAHFLMTEVAPQVTHFVDLHGGDLVEMVTPFVAIKLIGQPKVDDAALDMARHYGPDKLIAIGPEAVGWTGVGTLFSSMALAGVPALLAEAGGCGLLDEESTLILYNGVLNLLHSLGMLDGTGGLRVEPEVFDDFAWLYTKKAGFFYPSVKPGDEVRKGDVVGRTCDVFGAEAERVVSTVRGRVLFLVTSPAVRKNGLVMGIGRRPDSER